MSGLVWYDSSKFHFYMKFHFRAKLNYFVISCLQTIWNKFHFGLEDNFEFISGYDIANISEMNVWDIWQFHSTHTISSKVSYIRSNKRGKFLSRFYRSPNLFKRLYYENIACHRNNLFMILIFFVLFSWRKICQ